MTLWAWKESSQESECLEIKDETTTSLWKTSEGLVYLIHFCRYFSFEPNQEINGNVCLSAWAEMKGDCAHPSTGQGRAFAS